MCSLPYHPLNTQVPLPATSPYSHTCTYLCGRSCLLLRTPPLPYSPPLQQYAHTLVVLGRETTACRDCWSRLFVPLPALTRSQVVAWSVPRGKRQLTLCLATTSKKHDLTTSLANPPNLLHGGCRSLVTSTAPYGAVSVPSRRAPAPGRALRSVRRQLRNGGRKNAPEADPRNSRRCFPGRVPLFFLALLDRHRHHANEAIAWLLVPAWQFQFRQQRCWPSQAAPSTAASRATARTQRSPAQARASRQASHAVPDRRVPEEL